MYENFYFNEILFAVLWGIAAFVCKEFIISKDGQLRKIMIAYFAWEAFTYIAYGVDAAAAHYHWPRLSYDLFRVCILAPKAVIKIWLLSWFISNK